MSGAAQRRRSERSGRFKCAACGGGDCVRRRLLFGVATRCSIDVISFDVGGDDDDGAIGVSIGGDDDDAARWTMPAAA